jgi:hypothetical protein
MSDTTSSGGIGVAGLLGCIFVTLKLTGTITWSWWWVTCPFWGGLAILLGILCVAGVGAGLVASIAYIIEKWSK